MTEDTSKRIVRKHVVMNEDEFAIIKTAAAARGIGITTFLRQAALEAARRDRDGN